MTKRAIGIFFVVIVIICLLFSQQVLAQETSQTYDSDIEYLKSVMDMIKEKHKGEITDKQLIEGALKGMFDTMDTYTTYMTHDEADSFMSTMNGIYEGVGIMLSKTGDYIVVTKVFSASPAEKAGAIQGDRIILVDGENITGLSTSMAADMIRGESGTTVKLGILRDGNSDIIILDVIRGLIKVNPVTYEIRGEIGYIRIDSFNANTNEFVTDALNEMDEEGIVKIILDIRNNPGGTVGQAVAVARKYVPEGLITKLNFKSEADTDIEYYSYLKETKYELVVLVNEMSASASEILAAAVQDSEAGILVGINTYGKAQVQSMVPLLTPEAYKKYQQQLGARVVNGHDLISKYGISPLQDEIMGWSKITTGEYTTPKGEIIGVEGLTPDIFVDNLVLIEGIDINGIQKLTVTSKPFLGSEGIDVYNAEKILKLLNYDVDTPDMLMDQKTVDAVWQFRIDSGFYAGGVLDFTTQRALNEELYQLILEIDKQYAKALEVLGVPSE